MAKRKADISRFFPARVQFRFAVHLFAEGETEVDYLQKLACGRNVRIIPECVVSSPKVLVERAFKWVVDNAKMLRKEKDRHRVWIVFDDDTKAKDMSEVADIWTKCPDLCREACHIRDRNRCRYTELLDRINIGFMTPCIEIWGLMCSERQSNAAKRKEYSPNRHTLQADLHKRMPTYVHDGHPYFEVDKMTSTQEACKMAFAWIATYGGFPDCLNATRYAGIAPLVKEILDK